MSHTPENLAAVNVELRTSNVEPASPTAVSCQQPSASSPSSRIESRTSTSEPISTPLVLSPARGNEKIELLFLVEVLVKYLRLIVGLPLAIMLMTAVYMLMQPNIYTAQTLILPTQDEKGTASMMAQLGGLAAMAGISVSGATTTDLYITMLKSETLRDSIIDRFNLLELLKAKYRADVYQTLEGKVKVEAGKKDGVITISVDDKDPKLAAEIANAYVHELGNMAVRLNINGIEKNRGFLEERLAVARAELIKAEDALKAFQTSNKSVSVTDQTRVAIEGIARLRADLATREVQLNTLRRTYTESSQEVKNQAIAVEQLRGQIARMEGTGNGGAIPALGATPALGQEYARLMREFKIQESIVELLTKQYETARISEAKDISPFQVLQKARVPERKSKPKRSRFVLLYGAATFVASLLLAFVFHGAEQMSDEDRARWRDIRLYLPRFCSNFSIMSFLKVFK